MKRNMFFLLSAVGMTLTIFSFSLGSAMASTGCFTDTNGHWAEAYICWLKDNGIAIGYPDGTFKPGNPVTRAEMAVMLKNSNGVPPQSGLILVSAGNANWMPVEYNSATHMERNSSLKLTNPAAGAVDFTIQPDFTPVLYGMSVKLVGVEFCYTANENVFLDYVVLKTQFASNSAGSATIHYVDYNNYSDAACRYYLLSTPHSLGVEDGVSLTVTINWVLTGVPFYIGRTTFVFQPTGTTAALPASYVSGETSLGDLPAGDP